MRYGGIDHVLLYAPPPHQPEEPPLPTRGGASGGNADSRVLEVPSRPPSVPLFSGTTASVRMVRQGVRSCGYMDLGEVWCGQTWKHTQHDGSANHLIHLLHRLAVMEIRMLGKLHAGHWLIAAYERAPSKRCCGAC